MRNSNPWVVAAIAALLLLLAATSAIATKVDDITTAAQQQDTQKQPEVKTATVYVPSAVDQSIPVSDLTITLELNNPHTQSQPVIDDRQPTVDSAIMQAREQVRHAALSFIGKPYRWGGTTPNGFDCSGFTRYVYNKLGVQLPRTAREQYKAGTPVKTGQLKPGDLIFFDILKGYVSHVGMYLGKNVFIHAANPRVGVKIDSLNKPYYKKYYVGARRFSLS